MQTSFSGLLKEFNDLVDSSPSVKSIESQLKSISEAANLSHELNSNQKNAIIARVDNYLNGKYGKKIK